MVPDSASLLDSLGVGSSSLWGTNDHPKPLPVGLIFIGPLGLLDHHKMGR